MVFAILVREELTLGVHSFGGESVSEPGLYDLGVERGGDWRADGRRFAPPGL